MSFQIGMTFFMIGTHTHKYFEEGWGPIYNTEIKNYHKTIFKN